MSNIVDIEGARVRARSGSSTDTIGVLRLLLAQAERGEVVGVAYAAIHREKRYSTHFVGECWRNPMFTAGIVASLQHDIQVQARGAVVRNDEAGVRGGRMRQPPSGSPHPDASSTLPHLREAARTALQETIPKAVDAGAFPAVGGSESALAIARSDWAPWEGKLVSDVEAHVAALDASERTRLLLGRFLLDLEATVSDHLAGGQAWMNSALQLRLEFTRLAGYIDGWRRSSADHTSKAAAGRRKIGQASDDRVRMAVEPFRQRGDSKNKAAAELAEKVALSEGTLIKKLGRLFPGDSWEWPKDGT